MYIYQYIYSCIIHSWYHRGDEECVAQILRVATIWGKRIFREGRINVGRSVRPIPSDGVKNHNQALIIIEPDVTLGHGDGVWLCLSKGHDGVPRCLREVHAVVGNCPSNLLVDFVWVRAFAGAVRGARCEHMEQSCVWMVDVA